MKHRDASVWLGAVHTLYELTITLVPAPSGAHLSDRFPIHSAEPLKGVVQVPAVSCVEVKCG
jgi:hypothetical protein